MAEIFQYDKIEKYKVVAECTQPMHIGSGENGRTQVLTHPVDGIPFVQSSSIAGVFRNCYEKIYGQDEAEKVFGKSGVDGAESTQSRIRISDGRFQTENLAIELRPHVKINRKTGAVDRNAVQGSGKDSGQKFNMEYIGAGTQFSFSIYLYGMEDGKNKLESVLWAIDQQKAQFGGKKSNGCGYLEIQKLWYKEFNMKNESDRKLWMKEESLPDKDYENRIENKKTWLSQTSDRLEGILKASEAKEAYKIEATGCTQGEILVKSATVPDYGKDVPDCMNIQNAKKEYIIPGSSMKGSIRNQMQQISDYLNTAGYPGTESIIDDAFGRAADKEQSGNAGNLRFFDTVVGKKEDNDNNRLTHRIHIDKFTGGVMHGGLFTEKSIYGKLTFHIRVLNKNNPDRTLGLLLLALRDMASGLYNIGSGSNVGRGFLALQELTITAGDGKTAQINFSDNKIKDENGMIKSCLRAVRGN